jgi:hypothetical protein
MPIARKAMQSKDHWETVYATKPPTEVSWYQSAPTLSLDLIRKLDLPADATIADIGGGASTLVDHLCHRDFIAWWLSILPAMHWPPRGPSGRAGGGRALDRRRCHHASIARSVRRSLA